MNSQQDQAVQQSLQQKLCFNGAQALLEALIELGVDTIFGYPGGAVLPLYDAIYAEPRIRHILVRHEQGAVHAAEGYARSTGKPGVVLVTSGPGMANTTSGLLDAMCDSIPVLCISGQVATSAIGTDAFQECDAIGISRPVTKWNAQIKRSEDVIPLVSKAYQMTTEGRPGPVLIDFPKDIQIQEIDKSKVTIEKREEKTAEVPAPTMLANIKRAADLIVNARRPVFYGGGGLINSGTAASEIFTNLVRYTGAPCTLTLMGLGAFPGNDQQFVGMLGMHGTLEANLAMHHADLIICIGARFDDRITGRLSDFCPHALKIHLDIDPASIDKVVRADVPLVGDCYTVLARLFNEVKALPMERSRLDGWWQTIEKWRSKDCLAFTPSETEILPQDLLTRINQKIEGKDVVVSTDVGQHQMWAAQYLKFNRPNRWLTSGGAGTMGYGMPAAIGAQIGNPDNLIVCVTGDASILMNIQEMATAIQHRTPIKVVLCNNQYMGMVRQWQELIHEGRYSHSYNDCMPDFVGLAKSFGWQSAMVSDPEQLDAALDKCFNSEGPYFLDVRVQAQENCFPMMPAGYGHQQVMLSEDNWYVED